MAQHARDKTAMQRDAAFLREVADFDKRITDYLSTAGFEDIHENEIGIISALARGADPQVIAELTVQMVIPEQALGPIADGLVLKSYLRFLKNPDAPGRKAFALTERGAQVYEMIRMVVGIKRWADFPFRQGDVVIATVPKSGTTWMQMICALLVFQTPSLPAPLQELSPWMEQAIRDEAYSQLADQGHRRFIKTHLLPGEIPVDARATYIVVARHPLDLAISLHHQVAPGRERADGGAGTRSPRRPILPPREVLLRFINLDSGRRTGLEFVTLRTVLRQLSCAWEHRDAPNVVFVHYEDLLEDLEGQMRRLAGHLGITMPEVTWPALVRAATFKQMRAAADRLQPLPSMKDQPEQFFRSGQSGTWRELLTGTDLNHYHERAARLAPPDLLAWLHR
jgi:aryl sulfotransferase